LSVINESFPINEVQRRLGWQRAACG